MRYFDLLIVVNRPRHDVYYYLANPGNLSDILPFSTTIDQVDKTNDMGVTENMFDLAATFHLFGFPIFSKLFHVSNFLTRPLEEMEFYTRAKSGILIHTQYEIREDRHVTQIKLRLELIEALGWLENFVYDQALKAQREFLINLKSKLEACA